METINLVRAFGYWRFRRFKNCPDLSAMFICAIASLTGILACALLRTLFLPGDFAGAHIAEWLMLAFAALFCIFSLVVIAQLDLRAPRRRGSGD
jgi:hypothetical protein